MPLDTRPAVVLRAPGSFDKWKLLARAIAKSRPIFPPKVR
jgi:hypothetical protein